VEYLQRQAGVKTRRSIYTPQVVLWLMIRQRLQPKGTLASSVDALLTGAADCLLSGCGRAQQKRISRRTGGYSHARQRLPKQLSWQVMTELVLRLREILYPEGVCPIYLLDGSSLELEASPSLRKAYPPAENQRGRAHWPVLRIVVLHELTTGLAEAPQWGPMYGAAAVSEQSLAEKAMDALAGGSILVGDRNFGVFSIAWGAQQRGLHLVARLTAERARKLAGGAIAEEGERPVRWTASRFDGRRQGGMPEGASVAGRLIAVRIGRGKSKQWLYLIHYRRPGLGTSSGALRKTVEHRNRFAFLKKNGTVAPHCCPQRKHDGEGTGLSPGGLQSGACGHGPGGATPPSRAQATEFHLRAERGQRCLAEPAIGI